MFYFYATGILEQHNLCHDIPHFEKIFRKFTTFLLLLKKYKKAPI